MNVELSISGASAEELEILAEAMLRVAEEKGLAVRLPERTRPYTVKECAEELSLGLSSVNNLINAKILKRVLHIGAVRVVASSLHAYRSGL